MFSAFFFRPFLPHEYDSTEHKLITFRKMRILHCKPLGTHVSRAATPAARPQEAG